MKWVASVPNASPLVASALAAVLTIGCGSSSRDATGRAKDERERTSDVADAKAPTPDEHERPSAETDGGTAPLSGDAGQPDIENPAVEHCADAPSPLASKRLVRLTTSQIVRAIGELVARELSQDLYAVHVAPLQRASIPLMGSDEGPSFNEVTWERADAIAETAARYVLEHMDVTGCASPENQDCVAAYLHDLATKAYRKPLADEEAASLTALIEDLEASGANPSEVARWGVYAILSAPQFLYRREWGSDATRTEPLTPEEMAEAVAFFLTDAPPDETLRAAVQAGRFSSPSEWRAHAVRLLEADDTRRNLTEAMLAYFGLPRLAEPPQGTVDADLRLSIHGETARVLGRLFETGTLDDLLTSRHSYLDARLARFYGVELSSELPEDSDGFVWSALPPERQGLLTTAGFLTTYPNGETHSVVHRGLLVRNLLECATSLSFGGFEQEFTKGVTQRAWAEERLRQSSCKGCHVQMDPYGLVFEGFDGLGRARTQDDDGSPIRTDATLADGTVLKDVSDLVNRLTRNETFAQCMARHWLAYGLSEPGETAVDHCAVQEVMAEFARTERGMVDLLLAVIASRTFRERSGNPTN